MGTKERFIKNTVSLLGSQVVIKILSFVLAIFMARYLGATDYGKYSFGLAYLVLFMPIAGLGLNLLVVREVSRKRESAPALVGTSIVLKVISSVFVIGLASAILQFIPTSRDVRIVVYIFFLGFILENISSSFSISYAAFERLDIYAIVQFIERIVSFGLILTLLFIGYRLVGIALVRPITAFIVLFINILVVRGKFLKSALHFNKKLCPLLLKKSWPFMADALFMVMYLKIDITMLQAMKDSTLVGWYAIASGFIFVFMPLQMAVLQSAYPIFSRTYLKEQQTFSSYFERISRFLFCAGVGIAVIVTLVAGPLVSTLYGREYIQSISMLRIVIWVLPLMSLCSLARTALMSCNLQRIPLWIAGGSVALNIMLNLFLIPLLGGQGAAIATILTQGLGLIILLTFIAKKLEHINVYNGLRPFRGDDFRAMKNLLLKKKGENSFLIGGVK